MFLPTLLSVPTTEFESGQSLLKGQAHILNEQHWVIVVMILVLCLVLVSAGKGLGSLINVLIKKVFGVSTLKLEVDQVKPNDGHGNGPVRECMFSPEQCADHKAEFERSKRNQSDIAKLEIEFAAFKTAFFTKLGVIESGVNDIKVSLAGTMAELKTRLEHGDKF
jgi:hypothetical protein